AEPAIRFERAPDEGRGPGWTRLVDEHRQRLAPECHRSPRGARTGLRAHDPGRRPDGDDVDRRSPAFGRGLELVREAADFETADRDDEIGRQRRVSRAFEERLDANYRSRRN